MAEATYRIRNWSQYNKSLVSRGSITFWFSEDSIDSWLNDKQSGQRGRSKVYSDVAIQCGLMIKSVFHLTLRACQGFLASLIELMDLDIISPDYTTLCRRQACLEMTLDFSKDIRDVVVDSTGFKVYGEGEWKVRQHGYSKRRTWRKLHLAVNAESHEIIASIVTENGVHDSQVMEECLRPIKRCRSIAGDSGYDTEICYALASRKTKKVLIPPRKNAKISRHGNSLKPRLIRDETIRDMWRHGRKGWKKRSGYHVRSRAETAMFRLKSIFGARLKARKFDSQATELAIACICLNKMTLLGMPELCAL